MDCAIGYIGQGCDTYLWKWNFFTPIAIAIVIGVILWALYILNKIESKRKKR